MKANRALITLNQHSTAPQLLQEIETILMVIGNGKMEVAETVLPMLTDLAKAIRMGYLEIGQKGD